MQRYKDLSCQNKKTVFFKAFVAFFVFLEKLNDEKNDH